MPYNTRRKSLSLPSLGIHVPMTQAARAALSSRSSTGRPSTSSSSTPSMTASGPQSPESQPSKRLKRSHETSTASDSVAIEQTPPPSPTPGTAVQVPDVSIPPKVDLEGINDDIVEGVILQLEATGNRPHLVKELALVLSLRLTSVQQYVMHLPVAFPRYSKLTFRL